MDCKVEICCLYDAAFLEDALDQVIGHLEKIDRSQYVNERWTSDIYQGLESIIENFHLAIKNQEIDCEIKNKVVFCISKGKGHFQMGAVDESIEVFKSFRSVIAIPSS